MMSQKAHRVWATFFYLLTVILIHWAWIGDGFELDFKILWLVNGVASLLFGSRILNPHFTPTAVAATNTFFAGATLLLASASTSLNFMDSAVVWAGFAICGVLFFASLIVLLFEQNEKLNNKVALLITKKIVQDLGSPRVVFTGVLLGMVWLFHRSDPIEVYLILTTWALIIAFDPVESVFMFFSWMMPKLERIPPDIVGRIAAHQHPGLVLIRQHDDKRLSPGDLMAISDRQGPNALGVALNYVGRDEGILLRALNLRVPSALKAKVNSAATGQNIASVLEIDADGEREVLVLKRINSLCGIVDSNSSLDFIEIEIIAEQGVSEGRLVDVKIGNETVVYQIIDGVTHEESVQQKNKYGYARAKARKIGIWDDEGCNFKPVAWLPRINSPVFLKEVEETIPRATAIGHFPETNYHASVDVSEMVTHNTAILGILGIGKSYLAIELIERMMAEGIKIICLDLTKQYADLLSNFVDEEYQSEANSALVQSGEGQPVMAAKEAGGSLHGFEGVMTTQLSEFLSADCEQKIRIINPSNFSVSKQTTNAYQNTAGFRELTPSEITAIISSAALKACQELGMTDTARVCLIYEEAHTLVPEWNSVASSGDQQATAASARAILQGRKYGLGCLLITQRTANVTKTILNQCNTIFAMRTFDDTGKEFLGNYIGAEYARILPSLTERHAVLFGKASSCDNPVLLRLNDRDKFLHAFRNDDDQDVIDVQ